MKKYIALMMVPALAMPAFANETETSDLAEETIAVADATDAVESGASVTDTDTGTSVWNDPAAKFPNGLQFGVGISATSGLNGFIGYANKDFDSFWLKRIGVRLDFAGTAPVKSMINSGIDSIMGDGFDMGDGLAITDAGIGAQHFAALIDIYPFGNTWFLGGIRITGGYYWGDLELSARLSGEISDLPDDELSFTLDDKTYRYVGNQMNASANLNWNTSGPYLGAGFDLGLFAGFKIYLDAGVVFTSQAAQLGLDIPVDNLQVMENGRWEPVDNPQLEQELKTSVNSVLDEVQPELNKLTFYPIIKIGFMYRF